MGILFPVILSEAKACPERSRRDLMPVARGDEILRFAQDDGGAAPQPATNVSVTNVFQSAKTGSANCVNCANPCLSCRFPGPYYGAQEFPVAGRLSGAISCRVVSEAGRSADRRPAKPVAEIAGIAEIPGRTSQREARLAGGAGVLHSLTPRTRVHRLPGLCLSGPFRSELSARSADRGRVVPVLDRSSGRSPIAPFAPSFP